MSPTWRPSRGLLALALLVLCVAAGLTALARSRSHARAEAVVEEAARLTVLLERPVHAPPALPGPFDAALAPWLAGVQRLADAYEVLPQDVKDACTAVMRDGRPVAELPRACADLLRESAPVLAGALQATHAERAGVPESYRLLVGDLDGDHPGPFALQTVARFALLQVREALARGDTRKALTTCLDTLALGRDTAAEGTLVDHMLGGAIIGMGFRPCVAAVDAASPEDKRSARDVLARLQQGWVPFERVVRAERLNTCLATACVSLDAAQHARLPASLAGALPQARVVWSRPVEWLKARHALGRNDAALGRIAEAARLPPATRDARMDAERAALEASWNPRLKQSPDWARFARRSDLRAQRLALLAEVLEADLARAEGRPWPSGPAAAGGATWTAVTPDASRAMLEVSDPFDPANVIRVELSADAGPRP